MACRFLRRRQAEGVEIANFYREPDRRQWFLLPVGMGDWIPDTDMVHLLLDVVGLMDLSAFEVHYRKQGCRAPPFAPWMMVSVLLYAYANGQRSSRKIERLGRRVPDDRGHGLAWTDHGACVGPDGRRLRVRTAS